ncbi:e9b59b6a-f39c-4d2a-9b94-75afe2ab05bc [Phialemonium atrogriseum]|uniref:E9b59b6a-f39c-4d2a-9b94-75afe2ab05bc n=1 Tax=Phialemonium atrogriseum TaxID=1093897 RepID=A0AAJ0C430_9PEZI|nr:e9b59b6a-f39c-4d2a-9b94-75afe2ab05bc [Phialemonium atrogriseum]KAK1769142.1 e9b59b6a-f39c-4d2a-9b94-75afe2ab05bc [Phialemonium atrogriseum]
MASSNMSAAPSDEQQRSIEKIQTLLKSKDDTSRFVGLALLKSVLDNSQDVRDDEQSILSLWESISPKFLDRLMRTGSGQTAQNAKDMLDLAVSVLHIFANLLPDHAKGDPRFVGKIPPLVSCLVRSSGSTEELILQTLLILVSQQDGAVALTRVDDLSPLTEIAPSHPLVLQIFSLAWLQAMTAGSDNGSDLVSKVDITVDSLVSSFKGTDAVTLLACLADLLPKLGPEVLPPNPTWIKPLVDFIRTLVTSRPTAAARAAYTNLAASLLQVYPIQAAPLLFSGDGDVQVDKPFSYLLINLLLVDIRSSFPTLLEELNSPSYPSTSTRLASAFDIISNFIGFLLRSLDDSPSPSTPAPLTIPPDRLLSLRKSISETMSLTIEYLRDRWDASVAGAQGLHPSARAGDTSTARPALAWDSKTGALSAGGGGDALVLAALRALAIWLREDDGETLRREAAGLSDMFVDLYRESTTTTTTGGAPDFRRPILVALEGVTASGEEGAEALLDNGGWGVLSGDLLSALQATTTGAGEGDAARGVEIVRVLLPLAEAERPGTREEWMDVVTRVAAWRVSDDDEGNKKRSLVVEEFWVAVLQLATALLVNAHPATLRRYGHSISAIVGIGRQLAERGLRDGALREELDDVVETLGRLG